MSPPVTCHILDSQLGKPAAGVVVAIYKLSDLHDDEVVEIGNPVPFGLAKTNADGRVAEWVFSADNSSHLGIKSGVWDTLTPGLYRIRFSTGKYFKSLEPSGRSFFPFIDVVFTVEDASQHYHVPLLLSAFSYTTYRGS